MNNRRNFIIVLALIIAFVISFSLNPTPLFSRQIVSSDYQSSTKDISEEINYLINHIADKESISSTSLLVINQHQRKYPELNRQFLFVKAINKNNLQIYDAMMDLDNHQFFDKNTIEAENKLRISEKYATLEPQLWDYLQTKTANELIKVAIWFESDIQEEIIIEKLYNYYPQLQKNTMERPWLTANSDIFASDIKGKYIQILKQNNLIDQASLGEWLRQRGFQVWYHPAIPSLTTRISKETIYQISKLPRVEKIYLLEGKLVPLLNIAVPSAKTDIVWNQGFRGAGTRVGVIEADTIPINHPNINVIAVRNPFPFFHASGVASAIASHDGIFTGMAPETEIVSIGVNGSGDNWDDVDDAILWAIENYDVRIMNASFTSSTGEQSDSMQWIDRVFDYYARYYNILMVAAAGNQNQGNHIGSPAKGYNVLAVGGTDDHRTTTWDDTMAPFSAWNNPQNSDDVYGDREKPEIVASACNLTLLNQDNQTYVDSGTSYAAPLVSGLAALLVNRNPELSDSPEALRAIIMASAWNNIEGPVGIPTGLDLKDGAGAIDASSAVMIASLGYSDVYQYPYQSCKSPCWWSNYVYNSSPDPQTNFPIGTYRFYTIEANKGERIRVALTWVSTPAGPGSNYGSDPLVTDLDLAIFNPEFDIVPNGYSASLDNSYELVDFYADKTGTYYIGIYKISGDYLNWIGIGWTRMHQVYIPVIFNTTQESNLFNSPYPPPSEQQFQNWGLYSYPAPE